MVTISFDENRLVLSVKDTGIGINKKLSEAIFEPFVQADTSLTRKHQGSGLGLSISRELVRRMGGDIRLNSEEGKGTEITVEIPVTLGNIAQTTRPGPPRSDSMTWSIPNRRQDIPSAAQIQPIETIALYTQNIQTFEYLSYVFSLLGVTVTNTDQNPLNVDHGSYDAVFMGMEIFELIPALRLKLLGEGKRPCLVLYSEKQRGPFFKAISEADNVILIRRPLAVHRLSSCLKDPSKYIGGHSLPQRFSSPRNDFEKLSLTTERKIAAKADVTGKTARFESGSAIVDDHKVPTPKPKKVLMVEDNEVNGKMGLKLLSLAGYVGELAEDGAVALEMIQDPSKKYDIVLMDCQVSPN
jgi:Histidine kinase-, DNA gyrase B-, and HSP90-like ATPase